MKQSWRPVIFTALNIFVIGWLAVILALLLRVLRGEDPLALFGIFAADAAFLGAGIFLIILNRYYPVSILNRALPFITLTGLTAVAILNVSDTTLWFGVVLCGILIVTCLVMTILTLYQKPARRKA
jgi:hypothetical protein